MNRRNFLTSAIAAAAALAVDPEGLLWTPKKTIFIPKPSVRVVAQIHDDFLIDACPYQTAAAEQLWKAQRDAYCQVLKGLTFARIPDIRAYQEAVQMAGRVYRGNRRVG